MAKRNKRDPRREPFPWNKVFAIIGLVALSALIFTGAWALTLLGPKKVNYQEMTYMSESAIPKEVSALLDRSVELQNAFERKHERGEAKPEDVVTLRSAIQLQKEYLAKTGNHNLGLANERIAHMTVFIDAYESKPVRAESTALEERARELELKGELEEAKDLLSQAKALEEKIIHDYPKSSLRTSATGRVVLLNRRIAYLTALPLSQQSEEAEVAAQAALERRGWETAQKNFQQARDLQLRLNQEFAEQRFMNIPRLLRLDQELAALQSLPEHEKIVKLVADGRVADEAGNSLRAAEMFQDAQRRQRELIANNKNSRFADPAMVDQIEGLRQTALSRQLAEEIRVQAGTLAEELRRGRAKEAGDLATILVVKVQHFHENYPRSQVLDASLQQRIEYLNSKRQDLGRIQELVAAQLLPVPGEPKMSMSKQEVSQALYQAVTGSNPSRHPGENLPVDSVSWSEAVDFCRRLSWILARPVRLPTAGEFRAALGKPEALDLQGMTWNLDNSKGDTQAVAAKSPNSTGFYDLLGNVAEWTERTADNDDDEAPVIGGNVRTPIDTLRAAPVANLPILNRNPFIGFRFVVNQSEAVPTAASAAAN